jgi:hypothetical protein
VLTEPWVAISCGGALAQEAALAGVGALGVLADHDEVDALLGGAVKGRRLTYWSRAKRILSSRPALDDPGRHLGGADGAEQDGVEPAQLVEHLVGQHGAVAQVAGAAQVEVGGVELDARGAHDLERLGRDLGPMPSPPTTAIASRIDGWGR